MGQLETNLTADVLIDEEAEPDLSVWFGSLANARAQLAEAAIAAATVEGCDHGSIGVRICDDAAIHPINREFLQHDYPTDVISFPYELAPPRVEGELIASFETAIENASDPSNPLSPREELLLYVVHGTLHIAGHDDQSPEPRAAMRRAEIVAMKAIGIELPLSPPSTLETSPDDDSSDDGMSSGDFS
ncbi:rRNA maturation RNase YbeY [Rhodopirellula sp. P2]|uniref:rRNA maturation RNase YbeY n=1 Tax=Rhodopirellula sp. P2 TaxID=2127060 RepID=UPI002367CADB|nr:rRNA maturation RNase YbeY [Rhodopirellula sp. P2]WDQ14788.1 rRNA maturation RNase YbeY [Rhodopirellula sp. P2]